MKTLKDIIEIIKTRRSVREYKEDAIPDEDIEFLIDCARFAPTGFNAQPWKFMVVKNKDTKREISERGKKTLLPMIEPLKDKTQKIEDFIVYLKTEGTDLFYDAPVLVIILGNENAMTTDYDCSMAAQTMMLAAHSKGIGSCWIGAAQHALMEKGFLKELGVPDGYKVVAPLIFGYPKGETEMPEKNEPEVIWLK